MSLRKNKYNAKKTNVDGITFDSKRESRRYLELKTLLHAGHISDLELQIPFPCIVNDKKICSYKADFAYTQLTSVDEGQRVFALPAFKGLAKAACSLTVSGDFSSALTSFSGLNKTISGRQFKAQESDRTLLQNELVIKYKTGGFDILTMDGKTGLVWDGKSKEFVTVSLKDGVKWYKSKPER